MESAAVVKRHIYLNLGTKSVIMNPGIFFLIFEFLRFSRRLFVDYINILFSQKTEILDVSSFFSTGEEDNLF